MAEATPRTFFAGASLVWGRQRVLWLIYVVNFVWLLRHSRNQ